MVAVSDTMKRAVISTSSQTTVLATAKLMIQNNIGTLPIVADNDILIGLVTISDVLDVFIPNYFDLIENMAFVHNFGALEDFLPKDVSEIANATIDTLMKPPYSVEQSESIYRAATKIFRHDLVDLPVVDSQGRLVGLASHVDVGTAFLEKWVDIKGFSK